MARSEETAPEMRVALKRASARLGVGRFSGGWHETITFVGGDEVGLAKSTYARQSYAHFARVSDLLQPETVGQTCPNSPGLWGGVSES